jgi:RHS repeat-associated protein
MLNDSAGRTMKYTSYDLPSEISKSGHKTEFSYGPSRARYKRVDTSPTSQVTTTLYLGSVEKVYYPDGSIQWKRNIAGVGLITQTVNSSGVKLGEAQRYLIKDHLGSLSLITDEIGAVEQSNYFDPWGRERKIVTSGSIKQWLADNANFRIASKPITTRGFTGHEQLAEVGLIHMNGRIYDGALGRFVQADPIIQNPMRVQSLNRYSYVWNNPLNATDPSGFCASNDEAKTECKPKPESDQPKSEEKSQPKSDDKKTTKVKELDKSGCWVNTCYFGKLPDGFVQNGTSKNGLNSNADTGDNNQSKNAPAQSAPSRQQAQSGNASGAAQEANVQTNEVLYPDVPCYNCPSQPTPPGQINLGRKIKERLIDTFNALPPQMGPGEIKLGVILVGKTSALLAKGTINFADEAKLVAHFEKHGTEFGVKTVDEYLSVAREIVKSGQKVEYLYKGETRVGYVQLLGNTNKGASKFAFVGTNNSGHITTLHTKSGKDFWKSINGNSQNKTINPVQ